MMLYVDPSVLDTVPDKRLPFDPDSDWLIVVGIQPHYPTADYERWMGYPCPTCGFRTDEDVVRKRAITQDGVTIAHARRGRVACSDCCHASMDGLVNYPGLPVGSAMNPDYEDEPGWQAIDEPATPTSYAGTLKAKIETRRERRERMRQGNEQGKGE